MARLGTPLQINSENDAWVALRRLLADEIDADDINLLASSFEWSAISVHVQGEKFKSSIPATFMRGLLDLQDNFLRSGALIIRDSPHINKLSGDIRSDLDLVFVVKDGSTDIVALFKEQMKEIVKTVGEKLSGKQIVVLILSLALIYGGYQAFDLYLKNTLEIENLKQDAQKDDRYLKIIEQLIEKQNTSSEMSSDEKSDVLSKAAKADKRVEQIRKFGIESKDSLFSHATDADNIVVQGISIDKVALVDINRRSRRKAEEVTLTELVTVESIDAAEAHHFRVRLRRSSGAAAVAFIRDIEGNSRALNALWKAESSRKPIMVQIDGRQIGRELREAKIRRAWTPRTKS